MELTVVHVTVGTTKFDSLIQEITTDRVLRILRARKCRQLILQLGNSKAVDAAGIYSRFGIEVQQYKFKFETTRTDIVAASLVIGHAGAGTCLDILNERKPGLLVINRELMNDHQLELALQLADDGYIYYCDVDQLGEHLSTLDFGALRAYSQDEVAANMQKFVTFMDTLTAAVHS